MQAATLHHDDQARIGGLIFLMGIGLAGWIGYNLLIERLPETRGRNPIGGIITTVAFLFVGCRWMKGQQA